MSVGTTPSHPDEPRLPREIQKWLQSLDLSYTIVNPKRDVSNGFLVAEILARFYPDEVMLTAFENGLRLSCKIDNWEQIYALCKKKGLPINKSDFDGVVHCRAGAAVAFLFKLFSVLTRKTAFVQQPNRAKPLPPFARPTAAWQLKNMEIHRIVDDHERTYAAIETLDRHNEQLGRERSEEAYRLFQMRQSAGLTVQEKPHVEEVTVREVKVKTLTGAGQDEEQDAKPEPEPFFSAAGALEQLQQDLQAPPPGGKLASDILKTFITPILSEKPDLLKGMDPRKPLLASFMEQCISGLIPEDLALQVFDTLSQRCMLVVEPLHKSPAEFHKVWKILHSGLDHFPETAPLFDALCGLVARLGELMRSQDPSLTMQLLLDVQLGPLAQLLQHAGKRDQVGEILLTIVQRKPLAHLSILRALKEHLKDTGAYILALSTLAPFQAHHKLLDDHLVDLHAYYAMVALHSSQPKIRVAGISILIALSADNAAPVWALLPELQELTSDHWWEVQAQLVILTSQLLLAAKREGGEHTEQLLVMAQRLFQQDRSKHVLQVGLVHLVENLRDFPSLVGSYLAVLLAQPLPLRERLFRATSDPAQRKIGYVMGTSSKLYDEEPIDGRWPPLLIAQGLQAHLDAMGLTALEPDHADVLLAAIDQPEDQDDRFAQDVDGWRQVFADLAEFVVVALIDAELHDVARQILARFWLCRTPGLGTACLEAAVPTLVQALRILYSNVERALVEEDAVLDFLRELRDSDRAYAAAAVKDVCQRLKDEHPSEYARSSLESLF